MKNNNWKNTIRIARTKAISMALVSLAALLGSCEDPLTAIAIENVRLASLPEYTLEMELPPNGSANPTGIQKVKDGEPLAISAAANLGFTFMGWDQTGGTGTATFDDYLSPSTTVRVTGGDVSILSIIDDTNFTITVNAGTGGSVSQSSLAVIKNTASSSVTATPGAEYIFVGWTVTAGLTSGITFNPSASTASITVTANAGDATIRANFALKTYLLTMSNGVSGYTNPYTSATVTSGVLQRIIAYPSGTYIFDGWVKTAGTGTVTFTNAVAQDTYVTLTGGPATIRANYRKATVTLTQVGNLAFPDQSTYPDSGQDIYRLGTDIYIYGKRSATDSVIRQVSVSSIAAPSSSSYRYITGTPAGMIGTGTYLIAGSSSNIFRMAISGFGSSSVLTIPSTPLPARDLSLNYENPQYIWAALTANTIQEVDLSGTTLWTGYTIIQDSVYNFTKIQATGGGLLAIREDSGSHNLASYDVDATTSATVTAPNDSYLLHNGADMDPGNAGKPILDVDREFAIVPVYDPAIDNYKLSFFEVTDYSSASYQGSVTIPGTVNYLAADDYYLYVAATASSVATIYAVDMFSKSAATVVQTHTISGFEKVDLVGVTYAGANTYVYCLVDTATGKPTFKVFRVDLN